MRPQTNKANMRDKLRRLDKRTHGVLREERRRKRSNNRRKRRGIRATGTALSESQLGEQEGMVALPKAKAILPTIGEQERDVLKKENKKMQDYINFLLWRISDQECKDNQEIHFLVKVHKGQARHIRRIEAKLRDLVFSQQS